MKKTKAITATGKVERPRSIKALLLGVFAEGLMVISVEMLGAKMLIPMYGNSLVVWTSVLGITISFLALGYFYGSVLAGKGALLKKLSLLFGISSLLILVMPTLAGMTFSWFMTMPVYSGSVIAALLLLGPSLFILGTSSPVLIQLVSESMGVGENANQAGERAGTVFAISTVAGVLFTFILGFWILPHWGIVKTILVLAILSFALSAFLYFEKKYFVLLACFAVLTLKLCSDQKGHNTSQAKIIYESEGLLGQLKVADIFDPNSQVPFRYLFINGIPQTVITMDDSPMKGVSAWPYSHKIAMLTTLKPNIRQALLLGIGGGSVARELGGRKVKLDLVDLDERMFTVAKKYFYLDASAASFTCDDARHYIRTHKQTYDLIVMDVFNAEVQPSYMFTKESFAELKKMLTKQGMMVFNFGEKARHEGISAYQSVCNTLLAAGFKVYCSYKIEEGINGILIISSMEAIDFGGLKKNRLNNCCMQQPWLDEFIMDPAHEIKQPFASGVLLTDDKPMLEMLNIETVKTWREWAIKNYAMPEIEGHRMLFK